MLTIQIKMLVLWLLVLEKPVTKMLLLAVIVSWVLKLAELVLKVFVPMVFVLGVLLLKILNQKHWQNYGYYW